MLTYCDLFCGAGGFSLGFKQEGYRHLGAIEIDEFACETYRENISPRVLNKDITEVHSIDFLEFLGEKPDIVLASPPCEGFTEANARRVEDPYWRLYTPPGSLTIAAIEMIGDLEPGIGFIIENVPAIGEPELRDYIREEFARVGYDEIHFNLLRAEALGSPSRRPRMFISNMPFTEFELDEYIPQASALDVLSDLPEPSDVHDIPDHELIPVPPEKEKQLHNMKFSDHLVSFQGAKGKTKRTWVRFDPYTQAPIVMGKSHFIHPFQDRQLTIRELARLQGFPDNFRFHGSIEAKRNQVGEAVSPHVSRYLARVILQRVKSGLLVGEPAARPGV